MMQLRQPVPQAEVERDIRRRDALWEKEERRQKASPGYSEVNRMLPEKRKEKQTPGILQLTPPAPLNPLPVSSVPSPKPPRTAVHTRIALIAANALHFNMKRRENEFFTTTMYEIERVIQDRQPQKDPDNEQLIDERLPYVYQEYRDVFQNLVGNQLPEHRPYDHKIVLTEPLPNSYSPLYKQNLEELEATKKYLLENLEKGYIEHSRSPFASPILCVRKPNGDLRICVDYRKVNALTRKDVYPIPRIDELLARPAKAKFFTKFDIRAAFNKIRMDPESEEYTTFRTRYGTYKCKVLPFGLCNGPATYQRYMNDVLIDYLDDFCIAYLDDILIYSEDEETHVRHVKKVLQRLRDAGLQVEIKKTEFHVTRTRYLGYILTDKGIEVDPEKVEALRNWEAPTTVAGVKSFLGFAGFYRQFVPGFSRTAKPILALQSPTVPFVWDTDCERAFQKLKEQLLAIPTLMHFDPELETKIETDASDGVIAGVLSQLHADGIWYPVAFYSQVLSGSELNWEIHDKELFAIITAFVKWRSELTSVTDQIKVYSDHRSLEYFMTTKKLNARQARWCEELAACRFRIEYTPGAKNARADILSRREQDLKDLKHAQTEDRSRVMLGPHRLDPRINAELAQTYLEHSKTVSIHTISTDEMTLDSLQLVEALLQENRESFDSERKLLPNHYRVQDGLLLYRDRLCIRGDSTLCTRLIREAHDQVSSAHPSATKTYQLLAQKYHWKGMEATCKRYVRNCLACRKAHPKQTRTYGLLQPLPIPERPMQHLCIDFKSFPPDKSGYNQIMVVIDRLSKQAVSIPCHKNINAHGMAHLFIQWIYRFGHTPESIVSDRGPQFISEFWSNFCQILGVKLKLSTAYHKETDGQTEIMNKYIDQRLRPFVSFYQDNWSELLPIMDRVQATLPHSSTGLPPYQILFGSVPKQSWDWKQEVEVEPRMTGKHQDSALALAKKMKEAWDWARINMEKAQSRMRNAVNQHRQPVNWTVGDKVFLNTKNLSISRPSRKLSEQWQGPFRVLEQVGNSYRLELPAGSRIYDVFSPNVLCKDPADPLPGQEPPNPPAVPIQGVEEWEVDEILASRLVRKQLKYRVSWIGYDPDPTWYDASNFMGAPHKLKAFHDKYPNKPGPPRALDSWLRAWESGREDLTALADNQV